MDQVPSQKFSVHTAITERIVAAIEAGAGEFKMPWHSEGPAVTRPTNAQTDKAYRGVNAISLWAEAMLSGYETGWWASYQQWQKLGAQVRRGEGGATIVFYREYLPEDAKDPEADRRLVARASRVFNADQVDKWEPPSPEPTSTVDVLSAVESFIDKTGATIKHDRQMACYRWDQDLIEMPARTRFRDTESYYAVLLHELTHWTGTTHRLSRTFGRYGSDAYAIEELTAELGAAFLCSDCGISNSPRPDHAAYIQSWLRVLKSDNRAIFSASAAAQEAVAHLIVLTSG